MANFAFLKVGPDAYVCGSGNFEPSPTPPEQGAAFYVNDFGLSDPEPWKIPSEFRRFEKGENFPGNLDGEPPQIRWNGLNENGFTGVFRDIMGDITDGRIKKSVPVLTETGTIERGDPRNLARVVQRLPEPLNSYGFYQGSEGFIGATPERLFSLSGNRLETMAVAGTAPAARKAGFMVDAKEIQEHELVAQYLIQLLTDLGVVRREERECMDLGAIVHFLTRIVVDLARPRTIEGLIERLHPTPALGSFPRTMESLEKLHQYRELLHAPPRFGAPFGVVVDGEFTSVVAIRNLSWKDDAVFLPSGCGIIEESELRKEWNELELKRRFMKEIFGL